jgi:hypothetical protein
MADAPTTTTPVPVLGAAGQYEALATALGALWLHGAGLGRAANNALWEIIQHLSPTAYRRAMEDLQGTYYQAERLCGRDPEA